MRGFFILIFAVFSQFIGGAPAEAQVCPPGTSYSCDSCNNWCKSCSTSLQSVGSETISQIPYGWSHSGEPSCSVSCYDGSCSASGGTSCSYSQIPMSSTPGCQLSNPNQIPTQVNRYKNVHSCSCSVPCAYYSCNCGCH